MTKKKRDLTEPDDSQQEELKIGMPPKHPRIGEKASSPKKLPLLDLTKNNGDKL